MAMDALWSHIGITWTQLVGVLVATTVLYLSYAAVLRLWGQRIQASTSTFSLVLATIMGSLVARAMLGDAPTLLGGLTAIATLVALEASFGVLQHRLPGKKRKRHGRSPAIIMVAGQVRDDALKAARLTGLDLATRLRHQGVTSYDQVALVILEARGGVTVLRVGERIDEDLLWDVPGAADLPHSIVARVDA